MLKFNCDLYLQIFESESTKLFSESEPQLSKITSISFNSSGHQVAIGLDDGSVKVKSLFVYGPVKPLKVEMFH